MSDKTKCLIMLDYEKDSPFIDRIKGMMFKEQEGAKVWFVSVHEPWIEAIHKISELDDRKLYDFIEEQNFDE